VTVTRAHAAFGQELFKLTASDGMPMDRFGKVDIDGNLALVGADAINFIEPTHNSSGSAYLFDIETGNELLRLTASPAAPGDAFGNSVAIHGNLAVVGAPEFYSNSGVGAAYLFDLSTGQQLRKLTASDGGVNDFFGSAIAINDRVILVGANRSYPGSQIPGTVYVFDVNTGQELYKLAASDAANRDLFGGAIAISGDLAIVGAEYKNAAYIFDVTTGNELHKLAPPDAGMATGAFVDIHGDIAIVTGAFAPTAYLFDAKTGQQLHSLPIPGEVAFDVGVSGNTAIVGDSRAAAYVFDMITGQQLARLTASDAMPGDSFSRYVAIDGNVAIVGAPRGDKGALVDTGAAYVYDISRMPGDFNADGTVDAADYAVWRNGLGTTYTQADYNIWRANFGRSAAGATVVADSPVNANSANVPEPVTAAILALGLLPLIVRRGR
jgi:WD40 repeat protein